MECGLVGVCPTSRWVSVPPVLTVGHTQEKGASYYLLGVGLPFRLAPLSFFTLSSVTKCRWGAVFIFFSFRSSIMAVVDQPLSVFCLKCLCLRRRRRPSTVLHPALALARQKDKVGHGCISTSSNRVFFWVFVRSFVRSFALSVLGISTE